MSLVLEIQRPCDMNGVPSDRQFRFWVEAVLRPLSGAAEVVIRIVDQREMQALNRDYRNKDRPTNVLSFPAELPGFIESDLLGDLVICAPIVAQEAERQGVTLAAHWAHMVVHGVLHLIGFDHQDPVEASAMEAAEVEILTQLGYVDPYQEELGT